MQPTASTAGNDAMEVGQSLIAELESAIQSGSNDKRVDTLRRITDLFVADADRFNDQQIGTFDNVLSHLIKSIEGKALQELSRRLAMRLPTSCGISPATTTSQSLNRF